MKEKTSSKRAYVKPVCETIKTPAEALMQAASGNAGTIGGGGVSGDAKRASFFDEEESLVPGRKEWDARSLWDD